MKVIIAGSRDIHDYDLLWNFMEFLDKEGLLDRTKIKEIVSGKAPGMDTLGERFAKDIGVPVAPFPADWDNLEVENVKVKRNTVTGKYYNAFAGFNRNQEMAEYADVCVIIRRERSSGSLDMQRRADNMKLVSFVKVIPNKNPRSW